MLQICRHRKRYSLLNPSLQVTVVDRAAVTQFSLVSDQGVYFSRKLQLLPKEIVSPMEFQSTFDPSSLQYKIMLAAFTGDLTSFKEGVASLGTGAATSDVIQSIKDPGCNFSVIHVAASGGSLQLCKHICEDMKMNVDTVDGFGNSALFYTAWNGRLQVAFYLMHLGADPNMANLDGCTPLHCAVEGGYSEMISFLLTCGAFVDPISKRGTPLHMASLFGYDTAVTILLENGASVHNKIDGHTPLSVAILSPSTSCVKILVKAGAEVSDTNDLPAITWSANNGLSYCIRRLLEVNADLNILCDDDITNEEPIMMPYPLCSSACHKRARFAVGCCGQCYCTVDHLLENHQNVHPIGVPKVISVEEIEGDGDVPVEVPGCVLPDCPPWWLCKVERSHDQVRFLFRSSDPTVGSCMVHSYPIGQNEPMVEF